jgi:hypothetical protein
MKNPFASILADLRTIPATFLRVTGAWFDPDVHGLPPLKTRPKGDGSARPTERRKVRIIAGRRFAEAIDNDGQLAWENLAFKTVKQSAKSDYLTDFDRDELAQNGLEEDKAEVLKPLWAGEMTNPQIVEALNGEAQRYGFGLSSIKAYTSAFSRALTTELSENADVSV